MHISALAIVFASVLPAITEARAKTRWEEDRADSARKCRLQRAANSTPEEHAVRCAEWFVERQGYTGTRGITDTADVLPEGIEWSSSAADRLRKRTGTLEPKAFALCAFDGRVYSVAFWSTDRSHARGITLDDNFGSLRMQHPDFNAAIVGKEGSSCRALATGLR